MLVNSRDPGTDAHSRRVGELARAIAFGLGCTRRQREDIYLAGRLHDIGKVALSDCILRKTTPLTEGEWELVRRHPSIGADLVAQIPGLAHLGPIIRGHHESYDGSGYPDGLCGGRIPLGARIVAVADAFDAMISPRPYRGRMRVEDARLRLRELAGIQFDPEAVRALNRHLTCQVPNVRERVAKGL
jgi:HD-GYP domain-containing protein (c-di-GMP phosphodiesterase class II)